MNEREAIDRGWFYVVEPEDGRWAPEARRIVADDGRVVSRRVSGWPARVEVVDESGADLPVATSLRIVGAVGATLEARGLSGHLRVVLGPAGTTPAVGTAPDGRRELRVDGVAVAAAPIHHPVDAGVAAWLADVDLPAPAPPKGALPARPVQRAMFFESLMNTDMPHNDKEISQGVLHMVSPLKGTETEVVLVNAKMPIVGDERPVWGLDKLAAALADGPIHFVGITLLEGYWDGVIKLIATLRELGCRAHVAVGGVMPSLAPEHVAAHLPDATFIARGAGEVFIPRLMEILGDSTIDTPFSEAQRRALLELDGLIVRDRAGATLLSCRSDLTVQVPALDRVRLDLSHVQRHHIEGGIELSTSRGCIYRCSFCSILGRESYQARSAGSIFDVLDDYEARFRELHPDAIPANAYRVHISDDDFACDRDRTRAFFTHLLDTPFRLSSVQVAVGDLCRRADGKLLPEPDHELLDAMQARCFADHGLPIPEDDYFEDHKSRTWSSFLQIGVETYSDREIARLGKGYKRVHIRTVVAELARRDLHMDGYFILSNTDTTAADLVDVFAEVARLKLRFPYHFHLRFPVVQHLVSYFTAASHRRHVRRGRTHLMTLRGFASVPGHPEFDYPFVDHDLPEDTWVRRTVEAPFVTDRGLYTGNLEVLGSRWRTWHDDLPDDHPDRARIGRLLRRLDDLPRRLVFDMLRHAWFGEDDGWPCAVLDKEQGLRTAERVLGPAAGWLPLLRWWLQAERERRLLVDVSTSTDAVRSAAVDLLLASDSPRLCLHLLAAHGPADPHRLVDLVDAARARCAERSEPAELRVVVDGDGWTPTAAIAARLAAAGAEVQWVRRLPEVSVPAGWTVLRDAGVDVRVIVQVPVDHVDALGEAWRVLSTAGMPEVAIEPLAEGWDGAPAERLGAALYRLAPELDGVTWLANLTGTPARSGHTGELLVDADGTIGRSDGLVPGEGLRPDARLGHVDALTNVDRHHLELGDPTLPHGGARLTALRRRRAAADRVLRSFAAWARRRPGDDRVTAPAATR